MKIQISLSIFLIYEWWISLPIHHGAFLILIFILLVIATRLQRLPRTSILKKILSEDMSWLAWFHLGKVQEGFGMMRLLVVVKTINCSAVQLLRVISLSHRAAQAGEMKSFPRDSSPLSRLPLTEGQPIGVRRSLFLGAWQSLRMPAGL